MLLDKIAPKLLTPFKDCLQVPQVLHPNTHSILYIDEQATSVRLHSELPATVVWTYNCCFPGPTIEVNRGQKVIVEWTNKIDGSLPITVVANAGDNSQNEPGQGDGKLVAGIDKLPAWTVVHLHGGRTSPDSDGWTENGILHGQSRIDTYKNDQRATMLWYHDHAMGITRYNVFAGLAGMWIIRDEEERNLHLPSGKYEVPLLIQDRNLETTEDGRFTGKLLHKIEANTTEFFGPYTLVNGTIWPHFPVEARPYRLRILNGSNARTYRLVLLDRDKKPVNDAIKQIGTDGGLLAKPVDLPSNGLVLAPAERADIIVDFAKFPGQELILVNTAEAPFGNAGIDSFPSGWKPGDTAADLKLAYPNIMKFCVSTEIVKNSFVLPERLSSFQRWTHDDLPQEHNHRIVALVESTKTGMLTLNELEQVNKNDALALKGSEPLIEMRDNLSNLDEPTFYRIVANRLEDRVNWFVDYGGTEVWRLLNLTGDTHPFHVHLVQFQVMSRYPYNTGIDTGGIDENTGLPTRPVVRQPGENPIDENEKGWKDTVRVNPSELVAIAAKFDGFTGRYMYHCHVIEHEDNEMMRPYVVMPAEVMDFMPPMGHSEQGGHHH